MLKISCLLTVFLLCTILYWSCVEGEHFILTDDNYEEKLDYSQEPWLVNFCDLRIKECKDINKEFKTLPDIKGVKIASVNCNTNTDPCLDYGIKKQYPSILLIQPTAGLRLRYEGEHNIEAWNKWVIDELHGKVKVLTADNFDEITNQGEWLVEFYTTWCQHCKEFAPTYKQIAEQAEGNYNVAKVDCGIYYELCTAQNIKGFPTIKFISNGAVHEMTDGDRTIEGINEFVETCRNPGLFSSTEKEEEEKEDTNDDAIYEVSHEEL